MTRRDFLVSTLVRTGFRTSLKGFYQFCECVELYSDNRTLSMSDIYARVGRDFRCSESSVDKNIRRLFLTVDACAVISELFDMELCDVGNKEIIALFSNYIELNREYYEYKNDVAADAV